MKQDYLDCVSVANMRESDRLTIERFCPGRTLMYRAALGVFRAADWDGVTAIAVGGGNNGGDGYALACILARNGYRCRIVKLSEKLTEDSFFYANLAANLSVTMEPYAPGAFAACDTIVDCLLGTGFQGSLRERREGDQRLRRPGDQRRYQQRHERRHRRGRDCRPLRSDRDRGLRQARPCDGKRRTVHEAPRGCGHWNRLGKAGRQDLHIRGNRAAFRLALLPALAAAGAHRRPLRKRTGAGAGLSTGEIKPQVTLQIRKSVL